MTPLAYTALTAAVYLTLHLLVVARAIARVPPDIGIPAPPPGLPRPYIQGASMLIVPLDTVTAEAVRKLEGVR